jgi:uncharacterized protein (DUF697 family)
MGVTTGSLKFANVWRVLKEVDLEAIRREAQMPFDFAIVGEPALAELARATLSPGGSRVPHRFVRVNPPAGATITPTAVLVVAGPGPRPHQIDTALAQLAGSRLPHAFAVIDPMTAVEPPLAEAAATILGQLAENDRLAFAHQLPLFRAPLFDRIIEDTARANASFAFTSGLAEVVPVLTLPLSLGDMVVLTKNQLLMAYRLALAAGKDGEPRKLIGELLGVIGGGLLFRQMARQLVGLIPIVGIIPKVAVSYGGTWAVGRAVVLWLTEGRAATSDALRGFSREGFERGRSVATDIASRGRSGASKASSRWERLRGRIPGLRRGA